MTEKAAITATAFYKDPMAALHWLERAFGFETVLLLTDDAGQVGHAEMSFRGCNIGIGGEWELPGAIKMRSPQTAGVCSQFMWLELPERLDDHHDRARDAGARIIQPPEDQFYGARTYRALDPEGHVWCFREEVRQVSPETMTQITGLKVRNSLKEA